MEERKAISMTEQEKLRAEYVAVEAICASPYQPRSRFDEEELEELAASIQEVGLLQPPLVRQKEEGRYELIAGERRLRACQLAGLKVIPVWVRCAAEEAAARASLIENLQRVDLNAIEVAKALKRLGEEFGMTQHEVAQSVGKKRSTVSNFLRLLTLPQSIQEAVASDQISMGHAKAILSLEDPLQQISLLRTVIDKQLTVHESEKLAVQWQSAPRPKARAVTRDFFLEDLSKKIEQHLGAKVSIQATGQGRKGTICVHYANLDDLDRLLEKLGVTLDA
jgi:ParB family chromosome partitioning protein